jgi:cephalosporin hydroxylase
MTVPAPPDDERQVVDAFHRVYYEAADRGGTWKKTSWLGVPTEKCPLDLWIYQEIFHELRPDVVIETGTRWGGSALFMASIFDLVNHGRVITIDVEVPGARPRHRRIDYLLGSSTSAAVIEQARQRVREDEQIMVVLDSDHTMEHVLAEMQAYGGLVSEGSYLIVEDTNINGNPVLPGWGPGPWEAVQRFLAERDDFLIDESREKFFMTFNPKGFLKRVRSV